MSTVTHIIPLNRVEGDIAIQVELDRDHVVKQARCVGTLYRGIENLMTGRGPLDGLVITPRICGICTTAHLSAAAKALDNAYAADVPGNAQRLRNITLLVEHLQNDMRHVFLLFMPDLTHPCYAHSPLYAEAMQRYQVLKGQTTIQTVQETKKVLEIIAILGGQWPHSSFMVPGGVVSVPSSNDIAQCRHLLRNFSKWYERRVLGCSLERWQAVKSVQDMENWLDEQPAHRDSDLGFYVRFGQQAGLDRIGRGHEIFISAGGPDLPVDTRVQGRTSRTALFPAGVVTPQGHQNFDPQNISEDISCAFYKGEPSRQHPYDGRTVPEAEDASGRKYSWAKAPRYAGRPAETGPLAELLVSGEPLFTDWVRKKGASVFARELARLVRPVALLPALEQWLIEMNDSTSTYFEDYTSRASTRGCGLIPAPRGLLGHWVTIANGKIASYQVITPTAWNASPCDGNGVRGPCEEALIGTLVQDPEQPVEVEQIVRSFDPCLVCTVHAFDPHSGPVGRWISVSTPNRECR
jgi:hydrogenase large subunit